MQKIGFSTGAVAFGDFRRALRLLSQLDVNAIELSALRVGELEPLVQSLSELELDRYDYISFHAPSKFSAEQEPDVAERLMSIVNRGWPIILHPDAIHDHRVWLPIQDSLCFENMDKRKPIGRTCVELESLFNRFDRSSLCFDIGHAHQVDRTMSEARLIGQRFGSRIRQIHVSEVNTASEHVPISAASEYAFSRIADLIGEQPLIIESVLCEAELATELHRVRRLFTEFRPYLLITD